MHPVEVNGEMTKAFPASAGIMMALLEQTGTREAVRREWALRDPKIRNLGGDAAFKILAGLMFDERTKCPLYCVESRCARYPLDRILGNGVSVRNLTDTALGNRLDDIGRIDCAELVWNNFFRLAERYGLDFGDVSGDGSNYTLYGLSYEDDGIGTMPEYGGNAKDGSRRLQKNIYAMTNSDGILVYCRPYDGNVSDKKMNSDAIDFLISKRKGSAERIVVTADSKLCFDDLMEKLEDSGMYYVTKVPANYANRLRDRKIFESAGKTVPGEREGLGLYDSTENIGERTRRTVVFRTEDRMERSLRAAEKEIGKIRVKASKLGRRRSASEEEALALIENTVPEQYRPVVSVDAETFAEKIGGKNVWRVRFRDVKVSEEGLLGMAEARGKEVLITNIPAEGEGSESAEKIVRRYRDQYLSEKNFRLMKSGMGVDDVYLRKPGRQDAVLTVIALATQMSNLVDYLLKDVRYAGKRITCEGLCKIIVGAEFVYEGESRPAWLNATSDQKMFYGWAVGNIGLDTKFILPYRGSGKTPSRTAAAMDFFLRSAQCGKYAVNTEIGLQL